MWTARKHFAWGRPEVKKFLLSLNGSHFYKRDRANPGWQVQWFDFYKAEMHGRAVYIHLFVLENRLVIVNSFKRDESAG